MMTLINDDQSQVGDLDVTSREGVKENLVDHYQNLVLGEL